MVKVQRYRPTPRSVMDAKLPLSVGDSEPPDPSNVSHALTPYIGAVPSTVGTGALLMVGVVRVALAKVALGKVRPVSEVAPVPPLDTGSAADPARKLCNVLLNVARITAIKDRNALSVLPTDMPVLTFMPSNVVLLAAVLDQSKRLGIVASYNKKAPRRTLV